MNSTVKTTITGRTSRLALASVVMLGGAIATGQAFAQNPSVSYGRITEVRQVDLRNQSASNTGALIGGLTGVASGSGQSSSNRALRGVTGAAVGRRVGSAAGSTRGFEYTVLAPDERCATAARTVPADATADANACVAAKNQVMKANTDAEFDRAERRMRLVCD